MVYVFDRPAWREPHSKPLAHIRIHSAPLGTTTGPDFGEVGSSADVADSSNGYGVAWSDYDGTV